MNKGEVMEKEEIGRNLTKALKTSIVLLEEPMKKHTSFKIGGIADIYVKAKTIEDIKEVVKIANNHNLPLTVIGNGSNILVTDKGIRGIVLEVDLLQKKFEPQEDGILITVRSRS